MLVTFFFQATVRDGSQSVLTSLVALRVQNAQQPRNGRCRILVFRVRVRRGFAANAIEFMDNQWFCQPFFLAVQPNLHYLQIEWIVSNVHGLADQLQTDFILVALEFDATRFIHTARFFPKKSIPTFFQCDKPQPLFVVLKTLRRRNIWQGAVYPVIVTLFPPDGEGLV